MSYTTARVVIQCTIPILCLSSPHGVPPRLYLWRWLRWYSLLQRKPLDFGCNRTCSISGDIVVWLDRASSCEAILVRFPCCICCSVVVQFRLEACLSRFVAGQVSDHLRLSRLTLVFEIDSGDLLRVRNEVLLDGSLESCLTSRVVCCTGLSLWSISGCICLEVVVIVDDIIGIERPDICCQLLVSGFFRSCTNSWVSTDQSPTPYLILNICITLAEGFSRNRIHSICLISYCLNTSLVSRPFLCFSC